MPHLLPETFRAWIDTMPGSSPALKVVGMAVVPTAGWTSSLRPAVPQGINPNILLLDLVLTPPAGMAEQVISQVECRYETPPGHRYTDVAILYEGQNVTVKVDDVSK